MESAVIREQRPQTEALWEAATPCLHPNGRLAGGRRGDKGGDPRERSAEVEGIRARGVGEGTLWWMEEDGGGLYVGWEKREGARG